MDTLESVPLSPPSLPSPSFALNHSTSIHCWLWKEKESTEENLPVFQEAKCCGIHAWGKLTIHFF